MGQIVYCNGVYVEKDEAKVSVFDHGLLYGDGVFEGIRAYHGRVFKLPEHINRLYESAQSIALKIDITKAEMSEIVLETLRHNKRKEGYIRLVVTRGAGDLGLNPDNCAKAGIICITDDITLYPTEVLAEGMEAKTAAIRRNNPDSLNPRIKSLNYLNNILAKIEANISKTPEAILLNQEGYVTEGTGDNIFIFHKDVLKTPPLFVGVLEGITRDTVLELAEKAGIKTSEELFTRHDLYTADECFFTGTAAEIVPVRMVDGRVIGAGKPGKTYKKLLAEFHKLTEKNGPQIFK